MGYFAERLCVVNCKVSKQKMFNVVINTIPLLNQLWYVQLYSMISLVFGRLMLPVLFVIVMGILELFLICDQFHVGLSFVLSRRCCNSV